MNKPAVTSAQPRRAMTVERPPEAVLDAARAIGRLMARRVLESSAPAIPRDG
jgi:hypothetical protein